MQQTGFLKWGFAVYRCTYLDDAAWSRYVQFIRSSVIASLDHAGRQHLLEQYLDIPVIQDRDHLDGAPKSQVRSIFAQWAEMNRQTNHGGPGTGTRFSEMIPRFNYCMYVDKACLDTLLDREEWERTGGYDQGTTKPKVVCAIIDADCEPGGEGEDGFEPVEGCTRYFPGWMYGIVDFIVDLYDRLHFEEIVDGYKTYERPPAVSQGRGLRMPL
jgi:hypothetical protein